MTSWPAEILGAFAKYFEVFTQPEFKAAMKSKPDKAGLSSVYRGRKGTPECGTKSK